jgi:hypothetical protein
VTATCKWALLGLFLAGTPAVAQPPSTPPGAANGQERRDTQDNVAAREQDAEEEIRFDPPTPDVLFRLESEASYLQRLRLQKRVERKPDLEVPAEKAIGGSILARTFLPRQATLFPSYVVYHPLYFQQINAERYGWELGVFQPLVSTAQFYGDVLMLPYKVATTPPWLCDTNAGYALPGEPEPLRLLTHPFSWRGVAAQAGVAWGGAALFP